MNAVTGSCNSGVRVLPVAKVLAMGRRFQNPKRPPRQRLPMPLQRPHVKENLKAEEERRRARRKLKPWERGEETK
jgi:hypothetical protein